MLYTSGGFRLQPFAYEQVIDKICGLRWKTLTMDDLTDVGWAYYHFSVQFRENLEIACHLYPNDLKLRQLEREECHTDNLSPWPGVASVGERLNHDEFVRRLLCLTSINDMRRRRLEEIGQSYLNRIRKLDLVARASSIAAYESGGLERVFRAILESEHWDSQLLQAFRYFLTQHIRFDNDPAQGHGALTRQLTLDDKILPLWMAFKCLLVQAVPKLDA